MNSLKLVLVRPKYPRNIGLVARAMANFGLKHLILVSPQCELTFEANQGAAQGQDPLQNHKTYRGWEDFYQSEPDGLRLGFSRRLGKRRVSEPLSDMIASGLIHQSDRPVYLIFGPEDHGLSTEDLDLVHRLVHLELPGEFKSMNLSHAVVASLALITQKEVSEPSLVAPAVDPEPFLRQWLEALNFDLESQVRWNALTMLKQLILRAAPTAEELHKLEMVVQHSIRRIKQK